MILWLRRSALITLLSLLLAPALASAKPLVADLSSYHIDIDSSFRGARLLLFGARQEPGRLFMVVRGPNMNYTVRKKERVMGIWLNGKSVKFEHVPQLYSIVGSNSSFDPALKPYLKTLNIGFENLGLIATGEVDDATQKEFSEALTTIKREQQLYSEQKESLRALGETLFKASVYFPHSITQGHYTADIYLLDEEGIVGMQSLPIRVEQKGFEAFVSHTSQRYPIFYGLAAVAIAWLLGWGANTLLRRLNLT